MGKLNDLLIAVEQAKDALNQAEGERDSFLEPILKILGATGGGIDYVGTDHSELKGLKYLHVSRTGSTRGCSWSDNYNFPLSIFEAEDPLDVAQKFVDDKRQAELEIERKRKMAELARLQKDLGLV